MDPTATVASLPVLDHLHESLILNNFNATEQQWPARACIHDLFQSQADAQPHAPCLASPTAHMTYGEAEGRANQTAHMLIGMGARPNVPVCILMERSVEAYVSMLAVMKSGGCYCPLDPDYPSDRLMYMLHSSEAVVLLATATAAAKQPELCAEAPQTVIVGPECAQINLQPNSRPPQSAISKDLAYILYTSGSTGRPKGVMVEHSSVVHMIIHQQSIIGLTPADVSMQNSSISFDASMLDLFVPLSMGCTVVPAQKRTKEDAAAFLRQMTKYGVTTTFAVPSELRLWLACGQKAMEGMRLRWILTGGEAMPPSLLHGLLKPLAGCRVHFMYGPTEVSLVPVIPLTCDHTKQWTCTK